MWSKIAGKYGSAGILQGPMPTSARWAAANLPKISEKTVHPAGAMWASPPTTGACKFALHIHKNILPSHCFGTRAYLLRGATQIRKWLNASLLRKDTGCAGPAISAQCALYACSADVLPDAAAKAFQQNGLLSGQAGNRYCFHVVAKDRIIELNAYFSSSYANPDRRAAIRGSAFLPRPDLLRTGRWTSRTGGACA
jgi:hypothetical protein